MVLFLNPTSTITFLRPRRVVVLDVQGNGDESLIFRVVDAQGGKSL
jgi:hypothetical protein